MPDPVKPTPSDVLRLGEYAPVADEPEPPLDLLALAKEKSGDCGGYARGINACISAILATRKSIWDFSDRRAELATQWTDTINMQVGKLLDGAGRPTPASRDLLISRERELNAVVASEMIEQANAGADQAVTVLRALEQDLAAGRRKAAFVGLSSEANPGLVAKVEVLERELRTRPLEEVHDAFDSAVQSNDYDTAKLLMLAAEPIVAERLATAPAKRLGEITAAHTVETRAGAVDAEKSIGFTLRRAFVEFREILVDPSLVLASEIFQSCLCPAMRFYTGQSYWDLPRAKSDNGALQPSWDERLDAWLQRFAPYGRSDFATVDATTLAKRGGATGAPPGWGPRRKTSTGWQRTSLKNLVGNPALPAKLR
jgi:hypothetical protein